MDNFLISQNTIQNAYHKNLCRSDFIIAAFSQKNATALRAGQRTREEQEKRGTYLPYIPDSTRAPENGGSFFGIQPAKNGNQR